MGFCAWWHPFIGAKRTSTMSRWPVGPVKLSDLSFRKFSEELQPDNPKGDKAGYSEDGRHSRQPANRDQEPRGKKEAGKDESKRENRQPLETSAVTQWNATDRIKRVKPKKGTDGGNRQGKLPDGTGIKRRLHDR
jgi:hypothetical protein